MIDFFRKLAKLFVAVLTGLSLVFLVQHKLDWATYSLLSAFFLNSLWREFEEEVALRKSNRKETSEE